MMIVTFWSARPFWRTADLVFQFFVCCAFWSWSRLGSNGFYAWASNPNPQDSASSHLWFPFSNCIVDPAAIGLRLLLLDYSSTPERIITEAFAKMCWQIISPSAYILQTIYPNTQNIHMFHKINTFVMFLVQTTSIPKRGLQLPRNYQGTTGELPGEGPNYRGTTGELPGNYQGSPKIKRNIQR